MKQENAVTIVAIIAIVVVLYFVLTNQDKTKSTTGTTISSGRYGETESTTDNKISCNVIDSYENTITITGSASDPTFQKYCTSQAPYYYHYPFINVIRRFNI